MSKPAIWTLEQLRGTELGRVVIWASPSVREHVRERLPWPIAHSTEGFPAVDTLVVVGGGTLIDLAKARRCDLAPRARLIAVPSLWGSGAEASPIAVLTHADRKEIRTGEDLLPDARVIWPELAESVPPDLARYGCGDCWAHALEGFLSPLADDAVRQEIAALLDGLLTLPVSNDPSWFEASARACAAQARTSVGLVHGIAHVLEPIMRAQQPQAEWGHARLCSLFLWPVLCLELTASTKVEDLAARYGVDLEQIQAVARSLFDGDAYEVTLPSLIANWNRILRDPCTRTNCVLVRSEHQRFFAERVFL